MEREMKTNSKIDGHILRSAAYTVFLSVVFIALTSAFNSPDRSEKSSSQPRALSFAERVAYQRAIEGVYWRHRIWPKENPDPKPSLDAMMTQAQLGKKVTDCLRESQELEDYWRQPITAGQLQAEMDRMARDTKQPEVLQELFEALGNDPAVIAECLARPILTERLISDLSAHDHTRHVESPETNALRAMSVATTLGQVVYTLPEIADACRDDTWTATTTANAPHGRELHTAVWTGTEMIVWGGFNPTDRALNTGGRYNPSTDSWTATSTTNAPTGRYVHTAIWTGSEMIVWGGGGLNTGGRYNPAANSWRSTSTSNAPVGRSAHTAVWTGSEMIVWGGSNHTIYLNTGGRYDPSADSWIATGTANAPSARSDHSAVWSGSEMIVWGGLDNTGGRYNPSTDSWISTSTTNAPTSRYDHNAVWTGSAMIVWGGTNGTTWFDTGGRYRPSTDTWTATSNAVVDGTYVHTAVWSGSEMIVWGGAFGGRYNPTTNSWSTMSTTNAPSFRTEHTAVWTGSEMIVWGGEGGGYLNTGGRYCAESGPTPTPTPTPTAWPSITPRPRPTYPPRQTPPPRPTLPPR